MNASSILGPRYDYADVERDALRLDLVDTVMEDNDEVEVLNLPLGMEVETTEDVNMDVNSAVYVREDGTRYISFRWKEGPTPGTRISNAGMITFEHVWSDYPDVRFLRIGDRFVRLDIQPTTTPLVITEHLGNVKDIGSFQQQTTIHTEALEISRIKHHQLLHEIRPKAKSVAQRRMQFVGEDEAKSLLSKAQGKKRGSSTKQSRPSGGVVSGHAFPWQYMNQMKSQGH